MCLDNLLVCIFFCIYPIAFTPLSPFASPSPSIARFCHAFLTILYEGAIFFLFNYLHFQHVCISISGCQHFTHPNTSLCTCLSAISKPTLPHLAIDIFLKSHLSKWRGQICQSLSLQTLIVQVSEHLNISLSKSLFISDCVTKLPRLHQFSN